MKKLIFFLIFCLYLSISYSQEWKWSNQFETDGNVEMLSVTTDNQNNVYAAGYFSGTSLTVGSFSLTNDGDWDGFVCKIDGNGTVQWLNQISSINKDEVAALVIVGSNLYAFGSYKAEVFFNGANSLTNTNNFDVFMVSYDLNGNFVSNKQIFYGSGVERVRDALYNDVTGQIAILSQFKTQIIYEDASGTQTITARSTKDLFIALTSLSGIVQDTLICSTSVQNSIFKNICLAPGNNYIVTGDLFGTIYFNSNDSITGTNDTYSDVVVAQMDNNLDYVWARSGGGSLWDHGNSGESDIYGNIYITGQIEGADVYFDSTSTIKTALIPEVGNEDIFIAKYNTNGNLQWIKRKGDAGKDDGYGLVQYENLVQFCGNIAGEVVFNVDTLKSSGTTDRNTGFATFSPEGYEIGARGIGGLGEDVGQAIAFDNNLNTIIAGYFYSTALNIGDSSYTNASAAGHGFIASYYYPFNAVLSQTSNISCNGDSTAAIYAEHYFGVGPYTYTWSPNVTYFNDSVAYNLPAGTYSVLIKDSRDSAAFTQIVISEPSAINISLDSTNLTCFESGDGAITTTVTGGTPTYTYAWTGPSGDNPTAKDQTGLTEGKYYLTVTDAKNCQAMDSIILTQPDKITFGNVTVNASDPPGTGSIGLNASGGTGAFTYAWVYNLTDSLIGRTYDTLQNLDEGDYKAYITDDNLCQVDSTITVPGALLRVDLKGTNVTCYNYDNGSAYPVIISGDKGFGYSYTFKDEADQTVVPDGDTIKNLIPGKYFVTATEQGGANRVAIDSVIITQPDTLALTFNTDSIACYGGANGVITLTPSGGNGSNTYLWSNGATSKNLTNIKAGWYIVEVTDAKSCVTTDSAMVGEPDSLEVFITLKQAIQCFGDINGQLEANVSGGTSGYGYLWDDQANQASKIAVNLVSGVYSVTVTDVNGCSTISPDFEISDPIPLTFATVDTNNITCINANDGSITVKMAGGTSPYSYAWNQAGLGDTNHIEGLFPVLYELTVNDANGCINDSLSFLVKSPATNLTLSEIDTLHVNNICFGSLKGKIGVEAQGGWTGYQYSRDQIDWQDTNVFTDLTASSYTISVRDSNGCIVDITSDVTEPEELSLSISQSENTIEALGNGGTPPYQYSLNGGDWQLNGTFTGLETGDYSIVVNDNNDCGPVSDNRKVLFSVIDASELDNFLEVYPNPSQGQFNLEFNIKTETELNIAVYSVTGTQVLVKSEVLRSGKAQPIKLDLSGQEPGIYLLQINGVMSDTKLVIE